MSKRIALISVYDKQGIDDFAEELVDFGFEILSSGGTAKFLREAGIEVRDVADLVGGGAILGHRVVTLSREVHAGLLARHVPEDEAEMAALGIPYIDLVCVDFYPLREAIERFGDDPAKVLEMVDIGGPTMVRSAAKGRRLVICDPDDRNLVLNHLADNEPDSDDFRTMLAAKAEMFVSDYCGVSGVYWTQVLKDQDLT